ncbi:hypothetical protein FsymDg_1371 [Candidatus Protofrankia datiscae]|uniref:Uncharacterized protein n=1 Tax=Candidatus Protofrankia datiscae TaxID=2716812 RepID=F8B3D3_9ACTN|nr:hypothetical protein FsymDg_1371 [Candidatus Protofrankia datiscae]
MMTKDFNLARMNLKRTQTMRQRSKIMEILRLIRGLPRTAKVPM